MDLGVTVLSGVEIEEVLNEGALEFGSCSEIDRKGRAGDLDTAFEINHAELGAEGDVVLGLKWVRRFLSPMAEDGIVLGS